MNRTVARWPRPLLTRVVAVAALEIVVVGGGVVTDHLRPSAHRLDAGGVLLLVLAAGALAIAARQPWAAFLLSLGATTAYVALGYTNAGPMFLGLLVTLYAVADPQRPRRSVAMGLLTVVTLVSRLLAQSGPSSLRLGTIAAAGWVAATLLLAHVVAGHRAAIAATEERARRAEETREAEARRRVAEERLRIARELHEVVSHGISVINVQAGVAAYVMDTQPEAAREALLTIKATSKEALTEMRAILGVLRQVDERDMHEPAPGLDQLAALIERTNRAGLSTTLTVRGDARAVPPTVGLAGYRIVQEALTNALRHAGPASADVIVGYWPDRVEIDVRDDGQGCAVASPDRIGGGNGLVGMRERATMVGGTLEAGPSQGRGYRVRACLPTGGAAR